MKYLITKARELYEGLTFKEQVQLDKTSFYVLTISKFIALKELIIKKDIATKTLYFNNVKYAKHIQAINYIADYVRNNGEHQTKINVVLKRPINNEEYLKESIRIFNKIRDSLAHGDYWIDTERETIKINNIGPTTKLVCTFPIKLLNFFSIYIYNIEQNGSNFESEYLKYANIIDLYERITSSEKTIKNNLKIESQTSEIKYLLMTIKQFIKDNRTTFSERQVNEVMEYINSITLENRNQNEYDALTQILLKETAQALNLKTSSDNEKGVTALYNYMQLVFSTNKEFDYRKLKLKGLTFMINPYKNNRTFQENYSKKIISIRKQCKEFITSMKKLIKIYNEYKSETFRHGLMTALSIFYTNILESLGNRNETIIVSIRNAIEHGNYTINNSNNIILTDQKNQNDNRTKKFICSISSECLYELTRQIDPTVPKTEYTLKDFYYELKEILPDEILKQLIETLDELSLIAFNQKLNKNYPMEKMYIEAAVKSIKQLKLKK